MGIFGCPQPRTRNGSSAATDKETNMNTYDKKPYYITTAIAYASGKPHIGNCYEIVLTDAIARFRRAQVTFGSRSGSRFSPPLRNSSLTVNP